MPEVLLQYFINIKQFYDISLNDVQLSHFLIKIF